MASRRPSASHLAQVIREMEVAVGDHALSESQPGWYVDNVAVARLNGGL
jgi:hypothetical protein